MRAAVLSPLLQSIKSALPLAAPPQVKQHNKPEDAWTVLRGKVYNMTAYLPFHPGGVPMLMSGAGRDCTSLFDKYHRRARARA